MKNLLTFILLSSLITACGADIAYKRGASARDYQVGKQACSDAKTEQALKVCLEEKGWAVQKLDNIGLSDEELFATASYDSENRPSKSKPMFETTEDIATETTEGEPTKTPAPVTTAKATPSTSETPVTEKPYYLTLPGPAKSSKSVPSAKTTAKTSIPNQKPKVKPNLMDTYVIKSWWKMGGNLTMLEGHMEECRTDLGEAHYPNKKTFTFTRGFAICMRNHGWRGLVEKQS